MFNAPAEQRAGKHIVRMTARRQIDLFTCRFSDPALETAYQEYMLTRHAFFDRFALAVGLVVYLSYAVMDVIVLERAADAIALRVGGTFVCAAALLSVHFEAIKVRLDRLIPLMVVFLGSILNLIIYVEPSIGNNYFIGLIQMAVFISFMLRAGFVSSNAALLFLLAGYLAAVSGKDLLGSVQLTTQMYFLVMMFGSCSAGIYILERYRRTLFSNARLIDEQNAQLARMIEELERTVSRKTALLKVFTHVMKTPVHQILGFLQVVRRDIEEANSENVKSDNIGYAESAAAKLRRSVEEMVDYHFVDNARQVDEFEQVNIHDLFEGYFYSEIESGALSFNGERTSIEVDQQLLLLAAKHLRLFFSERAPALKAIEVQNGENDVVIVDFVDEGPPIEASQFRSMTCPLTSIENYLSGEGANPEMTLRTAARALEQAGATLAILEGGRSGLQVTFPRRVRAAA
jgi:signal transduction histidine kinase